MAITSEIIGKLGGRVEETPVSGTASGASGSEEILHTVEVPEGETWLVVLSGDLDPRYTTSVNGPKLLIGEISIGPNLAAGFTSIAAEVTGTAEITLKRNNSSGTDTFTGHVYTAKM